MSQSDLARIADERIEFAGRNVTARDKVARRLTSYGGGRQCDGVGRDTAPRRRWIKSCAALHGKDPGHAAPTSDFRPRRCSLVSAYGRLNMFKFTLYFAIFILSLGLFLAYLIAVVMHIAVATVITAARHIAVATVIAAMATVPMDTAARRRSAQRSPHPIVGSIATAHKSVISLAGQTKRSPRSGA